MSDTENNKSLANTPPARAAPRRAAPKRRRLTRASLRGARGLVKLEELVHERLSESEEEALPEEGEACPDRPASGEGACPDRPTSGEGACPDLPTSGEEEEEPVSSPSNVRNLRKKSSRPPAPISLNLPKKRGPQGKFSDLMKRSRKQAQSYGMQFNRTLSNPGNSNPNNSNPPSNKSRAEEEREPEQHQVVPEDSPPSPSPKLSGKRPLPTTSKVASKEPTGPKKKKEEKKKREDKIKPRNEDADERSPSSKRKRPARSCAVPSGFWDPVVTARDSGVDSHSENDEEEEEEEEEEIFRAQRKPLNYGPPMVLPTPCSYSYPPTDVSTTSINDLGESVFPKKKFCLRPPTLDFNKRPLSDYVFKIENLWEKKREEKIEESSVKALGYTVKIYECKSSTKLFKKSGKTHRRKEDT